MRPAETATDSTESAEEIENVTSPDDCHKEQEQEQEQGQGDEQEYQQEQQSAQEPEAETPPDKQGLRGRISAIRKSFVHWRSVRKEATTKSKKILLYTGLGVAVMVILALSSYYFFRPVMFAGSLTVIAPGEIIPGDSIIVTTEVENSGRIRGTYHAVLYLNDEEHAVKDITLAAGEKQTVQFELHGEDLGHHTIKLDDLTETFRVLKPAEFSSSQLSVSPNPVNMGKEVTVTVVVKNIGEASGTHTVNLAIDGKVVQEEEVTLKGETTRTVTFKMPADKAGRFVVGVDRLRRNLDVYHIQRLANGTYLNRSVTGGNGQLRIRDLDMDTVVVLTGVNDPGEPLISVYVRKGSSFTVYGIRDGKYDVYLSMGEDWDTGSKRFTRNMSYHRFDEAFNFTTKKYSTYTEYSYWTIWVGEGGGGGARSIGEQEFPSLR